MSSNNDMEADKKGHLLTMMSELKELLRFSRDVELKQLLDKIESYVRSISKKENQCNAEIRQLNEDQNSLSSRLNSLTKELELDQQALDTGDSRRTFPSEDFMITLEEERKTQASLRNHLDEFQTVLERVRAENRDLTLRLSQYETDAIAARHNWLMTEAELKQTIDQLQTRVHECEAANVGLREEVIDAHQRAALIVRDTHHFLGTVRTGLHKFVRELRGRSNENGDSMDKCPSLREMLRLMQNSARNINNSSEGWMTHLSESNRQDNEACSEPNLFPTKRVQASLTKDTLNAFDDQFDDFLEPMPSSMVCMPDNMTETRDVETRNQSGPVSGNTQKNNRGCDRNGCVPPTEAVRSVMPQVCLNSLSQRSPIKTTLTALPMKTPKPESGPLTKMTMPLANTEADDLSTIADSSISNMSESTYVRDVSSRYEDEYLFRQHLEVLDCKLANLQNFMKQTS